MKKQVTIYSIFAFTIMLMLGCSPTYYANYTIRDLKSGKYERDTSYIYELPYETDKSYLMVQGYHSNLSHKNEYSIDFKMKIGTKICAARDGEVVRMQEKYTEGGTKNKYLNAANFIVIKHGDGTYAGYWHLAKDGAFVKIGDRVKAGDVIGLSGDTGYSAFPHLHFWVYDENYDTMPTRFKTSKGVKYLKPRNRYKKSLNN